MLSPGVTRRSCCLLLLLALTLPKEEKYFTLLGSSPAMIAKYFWSKTMPQRNLQSLPFRRIISASSASISNSSSLAHSFIAALASEHCAANRTITRRRGKAVSTVQSGHAPDCHFLIGLAVRSAITANAITANGDVKRILLSKPP